MSISSRFRNTPRSIRYALVAVAAFVLGSATIASAAPGTSLGSIFFIPLLNGVVTTPCNSSTTGAGTTTTCNAVVDANGQVSTTDAGTHAALAKNQYDPSGNLKVTSQGSSTVSGSVSVNNLPAVQPVSGSVSVNNLPTTQAVSGDVGVSGTVNVGNFPATQPISGTVHVDNQVASNVSNKVQELVSDLAPGAQDVVPVNMIVTYARINGCSFQGLMVTGGPESLIIPDAENLSFPGGLSVANLVVGNSSYGPFATSCHYDTYLVGY